MRTMELTRDSIARDLKEWRNKVENEKSAKALLRDGLLAGLSRKLPSGMTRGFNDGPKHPLARPALRPGPAH
jgi:hypothetical protein